MPEDPIADGLWPDLDPLSLGIDDFEHDAQREPPGLRVRLLACALAALACLYHAQHALAQSLVEGWTDDGMSWVHWEYDLEHGTGSVLFATLHPFGAHQKLYLVGLLPEDAANIQVGGGEQLFARLCSGSVAPPMYLTTTARDLLVVDFDIPNPDLVVATKTRLDYGASCGATDPWACGSAMSIGCVVLPLGSLADFVTVRPMEHACAGAADFDCDGDVDLLDFARFQVLFTRNAQDPPE